MGWFNHQLSTNGCSLLVCGPVVETSCPDPRKWKGWLLRGTLWIPNQTTSLATPPVQVQQLHRFPPSNLVGKRGENKSPNNVFSWEAKGLFLGANLKDLGSLVVGNPYPKWPDDSD